MPTEMLTDQPTSPSEVTAVQAAAAAEALKRIISNNPGADSLRVNLGDGEGSSGARVLAADLRLLVEALDQIAQGKPFSAETARAELTSQQAADVLNVSRPYLVNLLDEGRIPHRLVGGQRRVRLADLLEYKRVEHARRAEILDELTREAQELGMYDC